MYFTKIHTATYDGIIAAVDGNKKLRGSIIATVVYASSRKNISGHANTYITSILSLSKHIHIYSSDYLFLLYQTFVIIINHYDPNNDDQIFQRTKSNSTSFATKNN